MNEITWDGKQKVWSVKIDGIGDPIVMHPNKKVIEDFLDQLENQTENQKLKEEMKQ